LGLGVGVAHFVAPSFVLEIREFGKIGNRFVEPVEIARSVASVAEVGYSAYQEEGWGLGAGLVREAGYRCGVSGLIGMRGFGDYEAGCVGGDGGVLEQAGRPSA